MTYSLTQLTWLFFLYSLAGWIMEVCSAAIQRRKFVNRGFVASPFCPIYGFSAVLFAVFLQDLTEHLFFLFLGGMILATVLEYSTGRLMEKIFHKKLWDYSSHRFHLDGYICLRYCLCWGLLAVFAMRIANPFLCRVTALVPYTASLIVLWTLSIFLTLDFITTAMSILGMKIQAKKLTQLSEAMRHTSRLLENKLTGLIQRRILKSFPTLDASDISRSLRSATQKDAPGKKERPFAAGCSFYKIVCLFFLGAFLGDITETVFCYFVMGKFMSRSSVVYGPFSIVWGLGCSLFTLLLYRYRDKSDRYIFLSGTLLGGAYEYICSVFTELVFGTVFWDYSGFTFNLGGRINLTYCFLWGIAAVVWLKIVYPFLSKWIEKLPRKFGTVLCNCLIVFMVFNMLLSSLALSRYTQRHTADSSTQTVSPLQEGLNRFLDEHFPDERMERIYPNAKIVE